MARYVWAVKAYSHRDFGWYRWFINFTSKQEAQEAIQMVMPLAKLSREYINWKVIKTIAWGKRAKAMKRQRKSQRKQCLRVRVRVFCREGQLQQLQGQSASKATEAKQASSITSQASSSSRAA